MKTIDRTGTVVEVRDGYATVEICRDRCGTERWSCSCCSTGSRPERLRVDATGLNVGDSVEVSTPAYMAYIGVVVLFVLPLALAVCGGWIGAAIEGDTAAHGMPVIVGGIAGIAVWAPIAFVVNRLLSHPRNVEVRRLSGAHP